MLKLFTQIPDGTSSYVYLHLVSRKEIGLTADDMPDIFPADEKRIIIGFLKPSTSARIEPATMNERTT